MVELESSKEGKLRSAFIDWQSFFSGNGLIDLVFLILYGVRVPVIQDNPNLFEGCFEFYYQCLVRHGVDAHSVP